MRRAEHRGFTLLEALIAVAVAGVALTVMLRVYDGASGSSARAAERIRAVGIAEERLARLNAAPGLAEGSIGPFAEQGLVWRAEVTRAGPETKGHALFALRVTISQDADDAAVLEVTGLSYAPVEAGGRSR